MALITYDRAVFVEFCSFAQFDSLRKISTCTKPVMSRSHDFRGSLPRTFLIDARQLKVGFLHSWAVVFATFSGKSSLQVRVEELNNANLIGVKAYYSQLEVNSLNSRHCRDLELLSVLISEGP